MEDQGLREAKAAVARNVLALRLARGMTQLDLATQTGLQRQKISQIENASENLTLGTLSKMAKAFGVELAQLVQVLRP